MEHTPFGYVIVDGRPKVHDMEAARLAALYSAYLLGMSYENAAEVAGIKATHSMIKRLLHNKRYLGDDIYPRIIDDDTFNAVEAERLKREKKARQRQHSAKGKARSRYIHGVQNKKRQHRNLPTLSRRLSTHTVG